MGRAHLGVLAALALCCLAVAGGQGSATPGGTVGPVSVRAMNPSSGNGSAATEPAGVHHRALEASADWPTFACDPANTGHNPVATGPGRPVTAAWNTTIAGRSMSPVVVGETAYVPSDSGLFAVDRATGTVRRRAEGAYVGHPAVRNGSLYVVSGDTLSALSTGDRRPATDAASPNRTAGLTPVPIRTATSTPIPTETPTQAVTADAETGSATTSEPPTGREREETTYPPTTSRPPNDGLGRGLALAAILFLSGLGLVAGATGGLALAYSRFRTDQFETWESVLFALVLVGGLFAAVRGFTFDPSGGDTYSLAVFTSLGSAFLLVAWLLSRPVLWLLRDDETTDGAGKERLGPGVVVAGLAVLVVVGIVSLLVSVVTALVVIVIVGVIVAFYVHGD